MLSIQSLLLILSFPFLSSTLDFLYVTEKLQLNAVSGNLSLAAVADQNADKWSDVLLVNKTRTGKGEMVTIKSPDYHENITFYLKLKCL